MYDKQVVLDRLNQYIDSIADPMIQEFCSDRNNPSRDTLNDWCINKDDIYSKQFSDTIKRLLTKQECFLTRAVGVNPVMAIFRLKQPAFGYKDKTEVALDANITQTIKPILDD